MNPGTDCVHHRRRAPRGTGGLGTRPYVALAELPAPLFDAYLARLAQARDECQHLLARYQAQARTLAALLAAAAASAAAAAPRRRRPGRWRIVPAFWIRPTVWAGEGIPMTGAPLAG